jgi:hypothetical protein
MHLTSLLRAARTKVALIYHWLRHAGRIAALMSGLLATLAQAEVVDIKGCWRGERYVGHRANGQLVDRPDPCTRWFDGKLMHASCINQWGLSRLSLPAYYSVPTEGTLTIERDFTTLHQFSIQGDQIIETLSYKRDSDEDEMRIQQAERYSRRLPADNAEACLPQAPEVTKEAFAQYYDLPTLIEVQLRSIIYAEVMESIRTSDLKTIPDGAISIANMQKTLLALDSITERLARPLLAPIRKNPQAFINQYFFGNRWCARNADLAPSLASPAKQRWAANASKELAYSMAIANHGVAYISLFKGQTSVNPTGVFEAPQNMHEPDLDKGLGRTYLWHRGMLRALSALPRVAQLLPGHEQLIAMSDLSMQNEREAKDTFAFELGVNCLEGGIQDAAKALMFDLQPQDDNRLGLQLKAEGKLLSARIQNALDPKITGKCKDYESAFDQQSVQAAQGDWTKVRAANGSPYKPDDWTLNQLVWDYSSGCAGRVDIQSARRIKEAALKLAIPDSTAGHSAYCSLAHWYRYGFGGRREPGRAAELEAQLASLAKRHTCDDWAKITPMDPADPWRILTPEPSP